MELIKTDRYNFLFSSSNDTHVVIDYYKNGQDLLEHSDKVAVKAIVRIPSIEIKNDITIIKEMMWGKRASLCGKSLFGYWGYQDGAFRVKEAEALGVTYREALENLEAQLRAEIDTIQTLFMKRHKALVNAYDAHRIAVCRHDPEGSEYSFVVPDHIQCQAGDFLIVENLNTYAIVKCIYMSEGKADKNVIGKIDDAMKQSIEEIFNSNSPF